jgi:hypothetical protein
MITAAILAHPKREALAVSLAHQLSDLDPIIVFDHDPRPGNLMAALRAWSWAEPGKHHLVLQDDALPLPGFSLSAAAACAVAGDAAVCFWMRPWHPDSFHHQRAVPGTLVPVSLRDHWPPSVALAIPGDVIPGMLAHAEECHTKDLYDDHVIGCGLREAGVRLLAASPCIVDHDYRLPSTLNLNHRRRRYRVETYLANRAPDRWRL